MSEPKTLEEALRELTDALKATFLTREFFRLFGWVYGLMAIAFTVYYLVIGEWWWASLVAGIASTFLAFWHWLYREFVEKP